MGTAGRWWKGAGVDRKCQPTSRPSRKGFGPSVAARESGSAQNRSRDALNPSKEAPLCEKIRVVP